MINEGAILIDPADKAAISKYLNDMNKYAQSLFKPKNKIECIELADLLYSKSHELAANKFPFYIAYNFGGKNAAEYINDPPTITINIAPFTNWKDYWTLNSETKYCLSIDFKKIASAFLHEFIHHIQDIRRQEDSGHYELPMDWNEKPKYYKRGWEQQAHAIEYLEKLKQELNIKKPEALLSQLRKLGVLHKEDLHALKKSDYKSWKAIMKQAVMATITDLEHGKKLPWQR